MHRLVAIALRASLFALCSVTAVIGSNVARAQSTMTDTVWVNLRSRIYHCRGTDYYGKTRRGTFMVEAAARSRGYRANGGRACPVKATNPGDSIAAALPPRDEVGPTAPIGPTTTCTLSRIVDGDTVYCDPIGAIRLIGIDAPEHNLSPHFARATGALTALVPLGASLVVESDVQDRDRYDRRLGHLWYNGQLINWYMVRNGWAAAYRYPPSVRYAEPLDSAATWARAEQRGLWPDGGIPCRGNTKSRKTC